MVSTLFDFNGVLVDDESVHLAAFREVLHPLGVTFSDAAYAERYLGFDDAGAFRAILQDVGRAPSDDEVARLVAAKRPIYMTRITGALLIFEGAAALVRRRARLGLVGIVSGALRGEIDHCLGVIGVRDEIAFIVAAEDTKQCKPDPEGYVLGVAALVRAGGSADGAVVIEDSIAGIEAAKGAGLRCAAVAHSYQEELLRAAGADVIVKRLVDLTDDVLDGGSQ